MHSFAMSDAPHLTSFVKDKTAQVRAQFVYGRKEAHLS